jgi:hypothetical protein
MQNLIHLLCSNSKSFAAIFLLKSSQIMCFPMKAFKDYNDKRCTNVLSVSQAQPWTIDPVTIVSMILR